MDPNWWNELNFHTRETVGTSTAADEFSYKEELLSLMRTRDFISLLLTYPVKLEEESILQAWTNAFAEWKAQLLANDDRARVVDKLWLVQTRKALQCIEGLVPVEITSSVERGGRFISNHKYVIPEAILDLSIDLALEQLFQTLFSQDDYAHNIHYVRLSTRNSVEKISVVTKIKAALEDKHVFGIDKDFLRALWIDASKYESDIEARVQEEINQMMAGVVTEVDGRLHIEKEMANYNLVIVVDGGSDKKLDPRKVCFPTQIVVFITTESSTKEDEDNEFTITTAMDLNIRTQDHLLPWEIFCNYAGRSIVALSRTIQRIAVQIVEECRGHLLAIVIVAKSLKNVQDIKQWEVALNKLRNKNSSYDCVYEESDRSGIRRVMVSAFLNFVWEVINKIQKLCLELCLFIHNIKIGVLGETLMFNWINTDSAHTLDTSRSLFTFDSDDIDSKYTRAAAESDIRELLDRSVLLRCENSCCRLPVEVYCITKLVHTLNPSIIKYGSLGLREAPYIGQWRDLVRMELMDNKICELPQLPDCPNLKVLLLQGNVDLMDIPDSFFDLMLMLQCLDLSYTSIRDLPSSISKLIKLKRFYLRGCDLFMELPPQIGQLKNLEELDLDGTLITHLPEETRELINLQSLTVCFDYEPEYGKNDKQNFNSTIIPQGVISRLTQLNYLSVNVDPEDERWKENVSSILMEIFGLERLETLSIYVPKVELLELIPPRKSLNFRLVAGHHMQRFISRVTPDVEKKFKRCDRSIKFVNGVNVPIGMKINLGHFRAFYLDRHMTIKSLSDFELKNFHWLQSCILAECNEMETIVKSSSSRDKYALVHLESLIVFYMKNLRSIWEGPYPPFFLCLKSIALHTCPMLTTIFTLGSLKNLSLLEELIVEDCPKVTTLVSRDSSEWEINSTFLPRLRVILLLYLPQLVNIFNGLHVGEGLRQMGFYYCPKLQSLSKSDLSSKSLRVIRGESKWWEKLQWNATDWGDAGRPNFLDLIFSPINEEVDIMTQLAPHQNEDKLDSKRKRSAPLQGPRPPVIKLSKESGKSRKPWKATEIIYHGDDLRSDFRCMVQRLTGLSSDKVMVGNKFVGDDMTHMLETSTLEEHVDEMIVEND
ncbi:hypothetical protein RJT34_03612 [Clitoria ternatea]|uniref:NB-ARC domain-containing protein n=1 Tax=Clitoria ternatea TaxID=43366 RepID=A0AAN9PZY4_CLITE